MIWGKIVLFWFHDHQVAREGDDFQAFVPDAGRADDVFLGVAADDVIAGSVLVHHFEEHLLDARTLLVDGVVERIHEMVHALNDL